MLVQPYANTMPSYRTFNYRETLDFPQANWINQISLYILIQTFKSLQYLQYYMAVPSTYIAILWYRAFGRPVTTGGRSVMAATPSGMGGPLYR